MTDVVILTSSARGIASLCLERLVRTEGCRVVGVVLSRREQTPAQRARARRRRWRKVLRIGPFGALNGFRLRRWFGLDLSRRLATPAVHELGAAHGFPVHEVPSSGSPEAVAAVRGARADLGLCLGNGWLPPAVFEAPRLGMWNVHHELLPELRGAHSVLWQLYRGSRTTGFTIHRVDAGLDTGPILRRVPLPIRFHASLHDTVVATLEVLYRRSAEVLAEVVADAERASAAAVPQGPGATYTTPSFWQYLRMVRNHRRLARDAAP